MPDNPNRIEKFFSHLSAYFERHMEFKSKIIARNFQTMLRAGGETETTQDNIRDWLQLDEADLGFQLLTEEEISVVIYCLFLSALSILLHFPFIYFISFFVF
jgi:hypothetical protein